MANDFKSGKTAKVTKTNEISGIVKKKMGMVSELRKGSKFIHPTTGEFTWVNYSDEDCKGIGPMNGYTVSYIKSNDELWNKPVELR